MLDIRTKKLLPHKSKYYCQTQLPIKYQPEADAPRFKRILEEIFRDDPEKIWTIQEFSGCILLPKILVKNGLVLLGTERGANNGGDVLIHILSKLIGRENKAVLDISNFVPGDNLIMIRNKLLNISYSIPKETCAATSAFEDMVIERPISVKWNSTKERIFIPITKHILFMNDIPVIIRENIDLVKKVIMVKLNQRFTGSVADVFPEDKLSEELPGIFNWALEGLSRVLRNNEIFYSVKMYFEAWDRLKER